MAWALFVLSLLVRAVFLLISDNQDGDAFARIHLARKLVDQKLWNPTEVWLPIHFWIISIPYALGFSSQIWPRLLTALAGAGSVPFAYLISEELFGTTAGLIAGLVLAFNPLHIRFSVVTVSEGFLIFFVTLGLWTFLKYVRDGSPGYLLLGILAFNLASGQRMEAWLVLPCLATGTAFDRFLLGRSLSPENRLRALKFILGAGIFALTWSVFSWIRYGDPVYIATLNAQRVAADPVYQASSTWYTLAFWPAVLLASLGPLICPAGIVAAVRSGFHQGPRRFHGLMFFTFLAVYYVLNFRSGMITDARYGLLLVWLLVLNLGFLFREGTPWFSIRIWMAAPAIWLLITVGIAEGPFGMVSGKMQSISPMPLVPREVRELTTWLRAQPDPGTIVLGPGLPKYGPWLSLLDDWYGERHVKILKPGESLATCEGVSSHGFLVVGKTTPPFLDPRGSAGRNRDGLIPLKSAGDYLVLGWSGAVPGASSPLPGVGPDPGAIQAPSRQRKAGEEASRTSDNPSRGPEAGEPGQGADLEKRGR